MFHFCPEQTPISFLFSDVHADETLIETLKINFCQLSSPTIFIGDDTQIWKSNYRRSGSLNDRFFKKKSRLSEVVSFSVEFVRASLSEILFFLFTEAKKCFSFNEITR